MIKWIVDFVRSGPEALIFVAALCSAFCAVVVAFATFKAMSDQNRQATRIESATQSLVAKTEEINTLSARLVTQVETIADLNQKFSETASKELASLRELGAGSRNFPKIYPKVLGIGNDLNLYFDVTTSSMRPLFDVDFEIKEVLRKPNPTKESQQEYVMVRRFALPTLLPLRTPQLEARLASHPRRLFESRVFARNGQFLIMLLVDLAEERFRYHLEVASMFHNPGPVYSSNFHVEGDLHLPVEKDKRGAQLFELDDAKLAAFGVGYR